MKELKDYLHLYLGCECKHKENNTVGKLSYVSTSDVCISYDDWDNFFFFIEVQPILRPLSDMTEEEADMIISIRKLDGVYREDSKVAAAIDCVTGYTWPNTFQAAAEATRYLLSKHFDLFNLIESGLAIDKSK